MKIYNKKKFIRAIFVVVAIAIITSPTVGFVKYPECHDSVAKYQMKSGIERGHIDDILYYQKRYLNNGKSIFADVRVVVDRIEDNNIAVVEVSYDDEIKMLDIPVEEFNHPVKEGKEIPVSMAIGRFTKSCDEYYQFKSYDDKVWWALTVNEIGFTPFEGRTYTLIYFDNGTTDCTECDEKYDCECEVYDDIFFAIKGF